MGGTGDASKIQAEGDIFLTPDKLNFNERPLVVIWEVTQACDLACFHCRACAQPLRDLRELTTVEGKRLISEIAEMGSPIFVLTGGDPLRSEERRVGKGWRCGLSLFE